MNKKKLLAAYLLYKAGQKSKAEQPKRSYPIHNMSRGESLPWIIIGIVLAVVLIILTK